MKEVSFFFSYKSIYEKIYPNKALNNKQHQKSFLTKAWSAMPTWIKVQPTYFVKNQFFWERTFRTIHIKQPSHKNTNHQYMKTCHTKTFKENAHAVKGCSQNKKTYYVIVL